MFSVLSIVALLAASVSAQFTINTPLSVVVCQPTLLKWSGGQSPYFLSILPGSQPNANALVDLGQQAGDSVTWLANLPVGTAAFLDLRDSTGALAQSGTFTILTGTNTTCVGQAVVTSAGPSGAIATSGGVTSAIASSPSGSAGSGVAVATTSTKGISTKAASTSSGASSPTASKAAGVSRYAPISVAAMIGATVMALAA